MAKEFKNLIIIDHPLVNHKLSLMRDKTTSSLSFRQLLREITLLMGYEVTRNLPQAHRPVETPITTFDAPCLKTPMPVIVPILRAGLGMAEPLFELLPEAGMGHIGIYRDKNTHEAVEYLVKLPLNINQRPVFLVDPMLATGHSAAHAIKVLNQRGVSDRNIIFLNLVAAPEGVMHIAKLHPHIPIYTAALDEKLNDHAYIVPGLGDAGDRLFGTIGV